MKVITIHRIIIFLGLVPSILDLFPCKIIMAVNETKIHLGIVRKRICWNVFTLDENLLSVVLKHQNLKNLNLPVM